jgi:two-component system, NarL family, sensor kinase
VIFWFIIGLFNIYAKPLPIFLVKKLKFVVMRKIISTFFVLAFFNNFSQQLNKISEKEFEKLREKTEELAKIYPDSAITNSNILIKLAKKSGALQLIANAYNTQSQVKMLQSFPEEAYLLNKESFDINSKLKNNKELAKNYSLFGTIYQNKGDYVKATDNFLKSLEIAKQFKIYKLIGYNYRCLSKINLIHKKHNRALDYAFKSISIEKSNPNNKEKALGLMAIGDIHSEKGEYKLAEKYYSESFDLLKKGNYQYSMAWVLSIWAIIYYEKDIIRCATMMLEAQKIYDKIAPKSVFSANNIGNYGEVLFTIAKNDSLINKTKATEIPKTKELLLENAEKLTKLCVLISNKTKNAMTLLYFKGNLADIQAYKGDYKNAYASLLYKFKYNDSLFSQKNKNSIAKLESEKEVLQLKTTNEKKSTLNKILIGSSIGLLLIGFLGYKNFKNKQKLQNLKITELEKDKQLLAIDAMLKGQEEERGRIAKDLHDGLGGLLSGTKLSFTTMKENLILTPENAVQFEKSLSMLDTTISDLRKVAHNLMPEALVRFGLNEALRDFCNSIQSATKITVDYQKIGVERKINSTTETFIYRIIQELVNNAVKHANAKEIIVQLAFTDNKIIITVEDNGKGYDINSIKNKKGDGLNNIDYRVQYLNGTIDTITFPNNGTSVNIELNA